MTILDASSLHPKIPFPAAVAQRNVGGDALTEPDEVRTLGHRRLDFWARLQLFWIESERLKLPAPFNRRIAKPFDTDATGQATFYGCFDKIGCEEGERDCHVDVTNAALLAGTKLHDRGHPTRDDIIQPPTTSGDGADQTRAALELLRPNVASRCAVRE